MTRIKTLKTKNVHYWLAGFVILPTCMSFLLKLQQEPGMCEVFEKIMIKKLRIVRTVVNFLTIEVLGHLNSIDKTLEDGFVDWNTLIYVLIYEISKKLHKTA